MHDIPPSALAPILESQVYKTWRGNVAIWCDLYALPEPPDEFCVTRFRADDAPMSAVNRWRIEHKLSEAAK